MNRSRPTLLFLAFPFPPSRAIGAVRCAKLAKYLARSGWQVTVVTIDPRLLANPDPTFPDLSAAWCRDVGIQRIETGHGYRMLYGEALAGRWWERPSFVRKVAARIAKSTWTDAGFGWVRPVLAACSRLRPGAVDVILASGSPFPAFGAACRLGRRLHARVVLDYRDLWTMAPHAQRPAPARVVRIEQDCLRQAAGVWVVSAGMARCLADRFGCHDKTSVVTNGFDPDDFRDVVPAVFAQPTVVYAGKFYSPIRVIHPVLEAIARVNRQGLPDGQEIRLLYLGSQSGHVLAAARDLDALRWVDIGGRVPRQEVLAALKGALAASVITSVANEATPEVDSILTGKLFEAMGAGSRVLLVAPPGTEAARVVADSRAGRSFAGGDVDGMAGWLRQLVVNPGAEPKQDVADFAWPAIARKADAALRRMPEK
jgi:glycosyltransferase involved in cell wall biosynthesis